MFGEGSKHSLSLGKCFEKISCHKDIFEHMYDSICTNFDTTLQNSTFQTSNDLSSGGSTIFLTGDIEKRFSDSQNSRVFLPQIYNVIYARLCHPQKYFRFFLTWVIFFGTQK